jgi:subtilisin-like proprotein convertase family protein
MKYLSTCILALVWMGIVSGQSFWRPVNEQSIGLRSQDSRSIIPDKYETYSLDIAALKSYLNNAPAENLSERKTSGLILELPVPGDKMLTFEAFDSPVMQSGLAAKYPGIKSYIVKSRQYPGIWGRIAVGPAGLHGAIVTPEGEKYIDPYSAESQTEYIVYNVKDHNPDAYKGVQLCGTEAVGRPEPSQFRPAPRSADLVELRIYKMAVACTGEWGSRRGTVEKCLADMNVMTNRMNVIYEREMAMRFVLIDDNDKLIFLNASTDPYDNSDEGKKLVGINTGKLNALIPSSSYDIGHVLSVCFDIGGVAQLGSACQSNKGNGVTCNNNNDLSGVVTRVMAHEVGHQLNASHTWNKCDSAADQRAPDTAYEPGSGNTIMSYAGSCGTDNVASDNDDYFHIGSLIQMYGKTTSGGNAYACADKEFPGNHYPEITMPAKNYVIPISTPFELVASAKDEDGDVLTYCWEQYDAGELTTLGSYTSTAPLFRSYKPSISGDVRFFPRKDDILTGNLSSKSEVLPTGSRLMNFKFTVRDNHAGAGGVVWEDYQINSTTAAGPFRITYPAIDAKFQVGQQVEITWDVANTDKAPVNCQLVSIYGSFSGALRSDEPNMVPLALNVPNDGSQIVYIPNRISNLFRIVIKAADNIFLTSSRLPSKIEQPTTPGIYVETQQNYSKICQPETAKIDFSTAGLAGYNGYIKYEVSGLPSGVSASFSADSVVAGQPFTLNLNTTEVKGNQSGQILIRAIAPGVDTMERLISVDITGGDLSDLQTLYPYDGTSGMTGLPKFGWNRKTDALVYELQLSTNPSFTSLTGSAEVTDSTHTIPVILQKSTIHYWRVRAKNSCGAGEWSQVKAFMSEVLSCKTYESGLRTINISASGSPTVELPLVIANEGTVNDINIKLIKAVHTRTVDLDAYLVAPSGKQVLLWSRKCNAQNLNLGLDDQSPDFFQCPINTGKVYRPSNPLSALNGEAIKGTWVLRIEDKASGSGGTLQEMNLEICSNVTLDQPFLDRNDTLKIYPGNKSFITDNLLLAIDNNNSASELIYTIVDIPKEGVLTLNGVIVGPGTQFTQADVDASRLRYESTSSSNGGDSFSFTISDGQGGWVPVTYFNIRRDDQFVNATGDVDVTRGVFVYPNPTTGAVQVTLSDEASDLQQYRLTDISGRIIGRGNLDGENTTLDLSLLQKGVYILELSGQHGRATRKLIKL